jgi:GNAT superfamily N-acetyltransferase
LRRFLLALDPFARNERRNGAANDNFLSIHAETARETADWVLGAYVNHSLCGGAEIYCNELDGDAEVALAVKQAWQRRKVGTALLDAACKLPPRPTPTSSA